MKKVFNWQLYLKVHLQSPDFINPSLFHAIKQSTELDGFRFDLCREVVIVYQAQGILFVLLCRSSTSLCIVECSSRRPCLASLVLLVVNTEAPAGSIPTTGTSVLTRQFSRALLSTVVKSETVPK